jgi:hypothetical protein
MPLPSIDKHHWCVPYIYALPTPLETQVGEIAHKTRWGFACTDEINNENPPKWKRIHDYTFDMRDLFIGDYSGPHDLRDFLTIAIYRPQARRPQFSSIFIAAPRTRAPVVPRRRARRTPACLALHQQTPALRRSSRSPPTISTPSRESRSPRTS